jgi:hypothetical protein
VFCAFDGEALLVFSRDQAGAGTQQLPGSKGFPKCPVSPVPVVFLGDGPIVIDRGAWHGVLSLTDTSTNSVNSTAPPAAPRTTEEE